MDINSIIKKLPPYAQDIKDNFANIFIYTVPQELTEEQIYGIALTVCYSIKHEQLLNTIKAEAKIYLEEQHFEAAKIANAIMSMNNVYYRFIHMLKEDELLKMPSDLKMSSAISTKIDQTDFEMYMLGVSIFNGCDYCINAHTKKLVKKGISMVAIRNIGRIVSVLKTVADVLDIESLRSYELTARGENI